MFNNSPKSNFTPGKSNESSPSSINLIGSGTTIEGEVRPKGDVRIDGTIIGSVISKAKVIIGSTGVIQGDVVCLNGDIEGTIKGKTTCNELLFLKSTAKINGDIVTGKLVVEVGASFTGSCNMGPVIKDIKHGETPAEELRPAEKTA
jgi:cytoskeletal protein CcmA (bactofilin family)